MSDEYNATEIEEKWQARWAEHGINSLTDEQLRTAERPFYNLMMFPYPSAEGLHVGNMYAFTGADIYGRWRGCSATTSSSRSASTRSASTPRTSRSRSARTRWT